MSYRCREGRLCRWNPCRVWSWEGRAPTRSDSLSDALYASSHSHPADSTSKKSFQRDKVKRVGRCLSRKILHLRLVVASVWLGPLDLAFTCSRHRHELEQVLSSVLETRRSRVRELAMRRHPSLSLKRAWRAWAIYRKGSRPWG